VLEKENCPSLLIPPALALCVHVYRLLHLCPLSSKLLPLLANVKAAEDRFLVILVSGLSYHSIGSKGLV